MDHLPRRVHRKYTFLEFSENHEQNIPRHHMLMNANGFNYLTHIKYKYTMVVHDGAYSKGHTHRQTHTVVLNCFIWQVER